MRVNYESLNPPLARTPCAGEDCRRTQKVWPSFSLTSVQNEEGHQDGVYCYSCLMKVDRVLQAAQAPAPDPWAPIRVRRNSMLDLSLWQAAPGSPLTQENQAEWATYRRRLNQITIEFASPGEVVWPTEPQLVYDDPLPS